ATPNSSATYPPQKVADSQKIVASGVSRITNPTDANNELELTISNPRFISVCTNVQKSENRKQPSHAHLCTFLHICAHVSTFFDALCSNSRFPMHIPAHGTCARKRRLCLLPAPCSLLSRSIPQPEELLRARRRRGDN